MKVREGDVIGTNDGRYGEVVEIDGRFVKVKTAQHPTEFAPDAPETFTILDVEVASIV